VRTQTALSVFGTGPRIPEDLTPAGHGNLIGLILRDHWGRESRAA
jgi:hypothetical protein